MPRTKSAALSAQMPSEGTVEGYASTFDREPDSYGDVIAKGAFARTLAEWAEKAQTIPLLYGHSTEDPEYNIGLVTEAYEDERGLFVRAEFDADNPKAQYVRKLAQEGRLYQFSFAYGIRDAGEITLDDGQKAYELRDLDLFEVSLVQIPANQHAVITGVKGAEVKAGRRNSKADADELRRIRSLANEINGVVDGLLADDEDMDEPDGGPEPDANAEEPEQAKAEEPMAKDADELADALTYAKAILAATENWRHNMLKKKLDQAKADLASAIESEDVEAIKSATEAVKAAQEAVKAADEAKALMKSFGTNEGEKAHEATASTLGDFALKNLDLTAMKAGAANVAGTGFGFKTYTDAQTSQQILETSQNVVDTAVRDLAVRSLFGAETISGNALKYFILGAREDNSAPAPGTVSEGGAKPQFHIVESSATVTLQKIAGWFYETDELLEDNAFLKSALDARGLFELDARIEAYLLSTTLGTSGIGTATYTHGGKVTPDDVFKAMMTIKSASGLNADAVIMNPADYQAVRLLKDGTSGTIGQYYGGGAFYGPYGNGNLNLQPGLWGLNTVVTSAITSGTILVGNFKQGGSVITKANGGARIEVHTGDHDDAIYNRVTVVVEERLGLAVRRPAAFVKITESPS